MASDELDKILDSALASYSQEEPRPGLDRRILNRIRAEGETRRFPWLPWTVANSSYCILPAGRILNFRLVEAGTQHIQSFN